MLGTLEMPLFIWEINLILTLSENCVISSATRSSKFAIPDTKFYVSVVTLSTQDNAKLLQQLKSGFNSNPPRLFRALNNWGWTIWSTLTMFSEIRCNVSSW